MSKNIYMYTYRIREPRPAPMSSAAESYADGPYEFWLPFKVYGITPNNGESNGKENGK